MLQTRLLVYVEHSQSLAGEWTHGWTTTAQDPYTKTATTAKTETVGNPVASVVARQRQRMVIIVASKNTLKTVKSSSP